MARSGDRLQGLRVLVVEDEALVSFQMEDILEELGCVLAGAAARLDEALELVRQVHGAIDAAILDVNLAGQEAYPIAEALERAGVPFGFATGYGGRIAAPWNAFPLIQKPYVTADVDDLLRRVVGDP